VYEEKVDGWRMLAHKRGDEVRLVSRNGRDHTKRFPGIVGAVREMDASMLVLDGEVAVFDRQLVSVAAPPRAARAGYTRGLDNCDLVLPVRRLSFGLQTTPGPRPVTSCHPLS
jgi:hypothetical protein